MMNNMQLNKIKSYFWENMSLSRRLAFESELEVNAELKKEYLIYKSIHTEIRTMTQISEAISDPNLDEAFKLADEAISEYNKDKLEEAESFNEFDSSHQEIKVPGNINKNKKNKIRKLYLIVSSAAAILLIALMFRVFIFETNPDKLFENYYSPAEMALNNTRGSQENLNASLILASNKKPKIRIFINYILGFALFTGLWYIFVFFGFRGFRLLIEASRRNRCRGGEGGYCFRRKTCRVQYPMRKANGTQTPDRLWLF